MLLRNITAPTSFACTSFSHSVALRCLRLFLRLCKDGDDAGADGSPESSANANRPRRCFVPQVSAMFWTRLPISISLAGKHGDSRRGRPCVDRSLFRSAEQSGAPPGLSRLDSSPLTGVNVIDVRKKGGEE